MLPEIYHFHAIDLISRNLIEFDSEILDIVLILYEFYNFIAVLVIFGRKKREKLIDTLALGTSDSV